MVLQKYSKSNIVYLVILIISALAIRVYSFTHTMMMNLDGPIYIHQARALYYGLWQDINTCAGVDWLTLYSTLIATVYPFAGDWMKGAMAVNLIFGTLMIIPLYLFLRRFLDEKTSFLTTFIFVMLPVFVDQSVNIIRDPSSWFFAVLGLYFLVYDDEKETPIFLVFSSISFIIATATRIENMAFIMGGCLYTFMVFRNRKAKAMFLFLSPIILAIVSFTAVQLIRHPGSFYWYRFHEIPLYIVRLFDSYRDLEKNLTPLVLNPPPGIPIEFMRYSRTLIWFTALGVVLQSAMEAFFYPFFALLLLGLAGLKDRIRKDRRLLSMILAIVVSLIVLYIYCLNTWSMENRRLIMVIIPSAVFLGFGMEKLINWLHKKSGWSDYVAVIMLCLFILILTLPKDLKVREADKLVYKEIGETIARLDGSSGVIEMITLGNAVRWNNYYTNLHVKGAPCPDKYSGWRHDRILIGNSYEKFITNMQKRNVRYIVWEEKTWPRDKFAFIESLQPGGLIKLKEWSHPDTGKIMLFEVIYRKNN